MHRFIVAGEDLTDEQGIIKGPEAHHLINVLRLGPGDLVQLYDGQGTVCQGKIREIDNQMVYIDLLSRQEVEGPPLQVHLWQGLAKGQKMDFIVQKAAELGATTLTPFSCRRSIVRLEGQKAQQKVARWQRIADEASKQSGRPIPLQVEEVSSLPALLDSKKPDALGLLAYEGEEGRSLKDVLQGVDPPPEVNILIGPEGGFDPEEAALAQEKGLLSVSLGPRILRTETAGMAVITMVLYQWGDLGGPPRKAGEGSG
jgi:16S rRNA (uracil1498-N3)-methyltransferase